MTIQEETLEDPPWVMVRIRWYKLYKILPKSITAFATVRC